MISHIVNGGADEEANGFREHPGAVPLEKAIQYPQQVGYLSDVASNAVDYQPDMYAFNMAGQSGTFMQGNDSLFHFLPLQPLHLTIAEGDTSFQLTDAHGTQYHFGIREYLRLSGRPTNNNHYISSWYLDRIVSANQADTIRLEYSRYSKESVSYQQQETILSYADIYSRISADVLSSGFTETKTRAFHNALRLRRILFKTGTVEFMGAAGRLDNPWESRLSKLHVIARGGQDTLKTVSFFHSYFSRIGPDTARAEKVSLRLDSLQVNFPRASVTPPYRFFYNTSVPLTTRGHGSRDHWGYHNGALAVGAGLGITSLIPTTPQVRWYLGGVDTYYGANRELNPAYLQAGILTAIRFPTGGWQRFDYEPNSIAQWETIPNPRKVFSLSASSKASPTDGPLAINRDSTFQVDYPFTIVAWTVSIAKGNGGDPIHNTGSMGLFDLTTATSIASWNGAQKTTPELNLLPGHTYRVSITVRGSASATFELQYEAANHTYRWKNVLIGGLRLREESIQATAQAPITKRRYTYFRPHSTISSGYTIRDNKPKYSRYQKTAYAYYFPGDSPASQAPEYEYATHTVLSSSSLSDVAGGDRIVGYSWVSVVDSSSTGQYTGRTVSEYQAKADLASYWHPPIPAVSNAWQRDQLRSRRLYSRDLTGATSAQETLVSKQENDYAVLASVAVRGFSVGPDVSVSSTVDNLGRLENLTGSRSYTWLNTNQTSGWLALQQSRQYQYRLGDTTAYSLATTTYQYGNPVHQQPTLVETTLSNGQRQQVRSRYVADLDTAGLTASASPTARAVRELLRTHAVAELVEQTTTRTTPTDTLVIASSLTHSRVAAPGVVMIDRQLRFQAVRPLSLHQFQPTHLVGGQMQTDSHYETDVVFDRYNAQRQLIQAHLPSGQPLTYLWDTQAGQPLAKVTNATVEQVAVTSFEPKASGRWTYHTQSGTGPQALAKAGRTGRWAYRLDSRWPIRRDSVPAGEYELVCWYQGAQAPVLRGGAGTSLSVLSPTGVAIGGWQAARARLRLPTISEVQLSLPSGSASVLVDDLSLYPVGAQLTSFTYDALRGMTSQTGSDGRTIFYEYDGLGRLVRTRDEQGRILSQQQYHYAGGK
jgi:YD repeat-containing protein